MAMSSSSVEKEARRAVSLLDHSKIMFPPGRETAIGFISRRTELGPGKFGKYRWLGEARFGECRSRVAPLSGFLRVCGILRGGELRLAVFILSMRQPRLHWSS